MKEKITRTHNKDDHFELYIFKIFNQMCQKNKIDSNNNSREKKEKNNELQNEEWLNKYRKEEEQKKVQKKMNTMTEYIR